LPGKPLADILGKPMIQHVYERALQVSLASQVIVATDDKRIANVVNDFNGQVEMTLPDHTSGTDRMAEVQTRIKADVYINLQGDEPLFRPADIDALIEGMQLNPMLQVGTLCHPISAEEAADPNTVKIVMADNGDALYFSRSLIPYPRGGKEKATFFKHIGVYAYRRETLDRYPYLDKPMLEQTEMLEQLRLLSAGVHIRAFKTQPTGPGVDTPECLERVSALMRCQH
jgi:3-deoxy-manno-octulosonate cytidylyltransferase (CMP-KDO synthetase)